jgi:hypothetical protein
MSSFDHGPPGADVPPSLFIKSERSRTDAFRIGEPKRILDLDQKDFTSWSGQILLVSESATAGWSLPIVGSIESAFDLLERHGAGAEPVAVVYPARRLISCYLRGTHDERAPIRIVLPGVTRVVTMGNMIDVIDEFRKNSLMTPQVCPPDFWIEAVEHQPTEQIERYIQWGVAVALRNSFRPVQADIEQITPVGRIDICMTNTETGANPLHPAVIELKAFRSKTSTGSPVSRRKNILWAMSGHRQAKAYRNQKKAGIGLLACFDLRRIKDDLLCDKLVQASRTKYFDERMESQIFNVYGTPEGAQEEAAV